MLSRQSLAKALLAGLALVLTQTACVTTRFELDEVVKMDGVMSVKIAKLHDKYKKGRFDMTVDVTNLHSQSIIFYYGEIRCFRDGVAGRLEYPFFGAGERAVDFKPGETKTFNYSCKTEKAKEPGGQFRLVYGRIFENPSNDGVTSGKQIAKEFGVAAEIGPAE
jgi:hypothetical protein